MIKLVCCVWLCFCALFCRSQQYVLYFTDKKGTAFSLDKPDAFLSGKALVRRLRYSVIIDSTDLPVSAGYLAALQSVPGLRIANISRWMNAVSVIVNDAAVLQQFGQLHFIKSFEAAGSNRQTARPLKPLLGKSRPRLIKTSLKPFGTTENFYNYGRSATQVQLHRGQLLHNLGLRGDSIIIGMLDAGFFRYNMLPAFDSLISHGGILGTWDFVEGEPSVAEDNSHGMQCLSVIAANMPGLFTGTAPKASFYLFRSEDDRSEKLIEEFNWVCAAERLDSSGGDIISSSLGYSVFDGGTGNHSYADMNGDITIAARGADLAARKGILVVASAGNSGNESWKYINTPADGDSVLAIGAVDASGIPAAFSSYGPAADGRVKPDVASVGAGTVLQGANGSIVSGNGTSFSAPNIAGLAACLWQGFREANNMQIIAALQQSATKANVPDNRVGYGIPDMQKAAGILLKQYIRTEVTVSGCRATVNWQSKDAPGMQHIIERKDAGSTAFQEVGAQAGTGAVWGNRTYSFTDRLDGISGPVQYRIKTVLDTAAASYYAVYSDTVNTNENAPCSSSFRYSILPNPVQNGARLLLSFPEELPLFELTLINSLGQKIWHQQTHKPKGYAHYPLPAERLVPGKYYLHIISDGMTLATLELLKL